MTLNPRAIALNGIGFQPLLVATLGFLGVQEEEVARPAGRVVDKPWKFFDEPKRKRRKRQEEIVFLGN